MIAVEDKEQTTALPEGSKRLLSEIAANQEQISRPAHSFTQWS
jgi:hypothetical protein